MFVGAGESRLGVCNTEALGLTSPISQGNKRLNFQIATNLLNSKNPKSKSLKVG